MPRDKRVNSTTLLVISCVAVVLFVFAPLSALANAQSRSTTIVPTKLSNPSNERPFSSGQETATPPGIPPAIGSDPSYDEQLGMTFTQGFYSMAYNVTAVEQTDPSSGTGPAYLLNGLSDQGYWYQVGVTWNWDPGYAPGTGFDFLYEVFDSTGTSIFPASGGAGLLNFNGQVNQGDSVLLNLYFSTTYGVVMLAQDQNTGAYASETYSAEGATSFVGSPSSTANSNGFFTGLMTEWYHPNAYYGNEQEVTYSSSLALSSAWMWIDEFECLDAGCTTTANLFIASASSPVSFANPAQLQEFSSNGATEYGDAYEFITGPSSQVSLTMSYSVQGGGTGYSPPVLTYVANGVTTTATLGTSPSTFYADPGSSWSVNSTLGGSTLSERWQTDQATSGTVASSKTITFVYYNQYLQILSYSVSDSSTPATPTFTANQFGLPVGQPLSTSFAGYWFDGGASWSVTNPIAGGKGERWQINATLRADSGTISSLQTMSFAYYHQFRVTFTVSPPGAGITNPSGTEQWEDVGPLSISATRNPHYVFSSWSSDTGAITYANPKSASTTATISGTGTMTANFVVEVIVSEQVSITMSPKGSPPVTVAISGCDANVASIAADGNLHTFAADAQCSLTFTAPARTSSLVWEFSNSGTGSASWTHTTGSIGVDLKTNTLYTLDRDAASYSVSGGGSGYSAPILSFPALGLPRTYTMTTKGTEIDVDDGSSWNVASTLSGSGSSERWQAPASIVSGTSIGGATIAPLYYHQLLDAISYSAIEGIDGASPVAPVLTADQFGSSFGQVITTSAAGYWFDAGASWTVTNPLSLSDTSQRWQTDQATSGSLSSVSQTTLAFTYYHQFLVTLDYSIMAGGSPTAPTISGMTFGEASRGNLTSSPIPFWLDSGSELVFPATLLPSNSSERWEVNFTLPFEVGSLREMLVSSAITETLGYQHQYFVYIESGGMGGGFVSLESDWYNATSALHLVASPNSGWRLGAWVGSGSGSFSGNAIAADVKVYAADVKVDGPISETAVFYPGLNLGVESGGSVTYSYGSTLGHASPGQHVLYVPPGTNVTLIANPSSAFYSFGGWVISHASGKSTIWVVVNAPTTMEATFSYNLVTVGAVAGGVVVIVTIATFYALRINGRRNPSQYKAAN